jgi:hypothetical protein
MTRGRCWVLALATAAAAVVSAPPVAVGLGVVALVLLRAAQA